MRRFTLALALLGFLLPPVLQGQEAQAQEQPEHVYLAFYRIGYADLDAWNRDYWEHSVPILQDLQEEGVIEGFNQWQHDVGSEYNVRFAVRTYDWASLGTFWDEYLSRLSEANPESDGRMIRAHRDEIWDIDEVHMSEGGEGGADAPRIYASSFRYNFADSEAWNRAWSETAAPILQEAMEQGILGGWVKLSHNTGGPHNSKILYFFESWDDIDDLFGKLLGDMAEDDPEEFDRIMGLFQAHDDVIWVPTTR